MKYLAEKRERMRVSIENTVEICNTWRYVHLRKTERGRERELATSRIASGRRVLKYEIGYYITLSDRIECTFFLLSSYVLSFMSKWQVHKHILPKWMNYVWLDRASESSMQPMRKIQSNPIRISNRCDGIGHTVYINAKQQ